MAYYTEVTFRFQFLQRQSPSRAVQIAETDWQIQIVLRSSDAQTINGRDVETHDLTSKVARGAEVSIEHENNQ